MKLSIWAKQNGMSYRTAWNLFKDGKLPVPAQQLETGTILVQAPTLEKKESQVEKFVIYARCSSRSDQISLDSQIAKLSQYAASQKIPISEIVTEVGSGMNGKRKKLIRLLADPQIKIILVEHRDRLTRFGFELIEASLKSSGRSILVLKEEELLGDKDGIVRDMIEVLTSFCARLYGRRSAAMRAKKAFKFITSDVSPKIGKDGSYSQSKNKIK